MTAVNKIDAKASPDGSVLISMWTREQFGSNYPVTVEEALRLVESIMASVPKARAAKAHHDAALRAVK